ncbi:MAG: asparagine synthase (glutamine-hydrolyzing) [Carboxydocellales bacterium]
MCGITGWIDWEVDLTLQEPILKDMTETLSFRGPDTAGMFLSPHAAIGHRRLVVVDPIGGGQPMIRQCGTSTYVLSYNGELYNTPELRRELETYGHTFRGHSDTEVLLAAYIHWGRECVQRLNGIFAFAVWNESDQSLFLARDRLGVKPLFYAQRGNAFFFASELKALLAHPAIKPEVDTEGLAEVFVMGPSRTPGHGVFCGVFEIRPGYCLMYNRNGLRSHRYWTLESQPHGDDLNTTADKVRFLLQDTIERQLVADVPICTLLSGGLDSSAITAFAAKFLRDAGRGPLHTYSIDYVDNDHHFRVNEFQPNSDSPWVPIVSEFFGTEHHSVFIDTPELVESLTIAMLSRDLPGMADVDSSLLLFCREIKKQSTVALSGECADEIFGGYPWFHNQAALASGTFPWMNGLETKLGILAPELLEVLQPEQYLQRRYQETLAEVPVLAGEDPQNARMREMFYLNIVWFMATLLDRKDRMSMATGLEVRVPFADHRLVEYVWNIPWSMKMCDNMEKGILRRALKGILPPDVLTRRKSPYPKTHHPAYLNTVRQQLLQVLEDSNSPILPLINTSKIRAMACSQEAAFGRPWFGQLMTDAQLFAYLLQTDTWLRKYQVHIR